MLDLSFASASQPPLAGHTLFLICFVRKQEADCLSPSFVLDRAPQKQTPFTRPFTSLDLPALTLGAIQIQKEDVTKRESSCKASDDLLVGLKHPLAKSGVRTRRSRTRRSQRHQHGTFWILEDTEGFGEHLLIPANRLRSRSGSTQSLL
jgi:hypothetical protein